MKLHYDPCTVNCRKVLAGLKLIGMDFESEKYDYFDGLTGPSETGFRTLPAYLAINPMAELPTAQARISEAGAEIEAVEALLLKDCADAMAIAESGGVPEINDRARWRRNNAFAAQLCVRALERLNPLVGARGLTPDNHFLRMFRDVHAASLQITLAWDIQAVNAGRIRFGLPSLDPRV